MKHIEVSTFRQKLATGALGVVLIAIICAFVVALTGCATGPDTKPYHGGGVELVSEEVGWASPPMPRSATSFNPPGGSVDVLAAPIQIRVGVRNGRDYAMEFVLDCGETGHTRYRLVTVVGAEQERSLYFSMAKRVSVSQTFECRIVSLSQVLDQG